MCTLLAVKEDKTNNIRILVATFSLFFLNLNFFFPYLNIYIFCDWIQILQCLLSFPEIEKKKEILRQKQAQVFCFFLVCSNLHTTYFPVQNSIKYIKFNSLLIIIFNAKAQSDQVKINSTNHNILSYMEQDTQDMSSSDLEPLSKE